MKAYKYKHIFWFKTNCLGLFSKMKYIKERISTPLTSLNILKARNNITLKFKKNLCCFYFHKVIKYVIVRLKLFQMAMSITPITIRSWRSGPTRERAVKNVSPDLSRSVGIARFCPTEKWSTSITRGRRQHIPTPDSRSPLRQTPKKMFSVEILSDKDLMPGIENNFKYFSASCTKNLIFR